MALDIGSIVDEFLSVLQENFNHCDFLLIQHVYHTNGVQTLEKHDDMKYRRLDVRELDNFVSLGQESNENTLT